MELVFLCVGLVLLAGLMAALLYVARYQWENRRPVIIAIVLAGLLIVMFAIGLVATLISGPRLELAAPAMSNPGLGNAYVSIMITNKGDLVAKDCTGEITVGGFNKEPVKVVWGDGSERKNIVAGGGNERLYFLVADPDKTPVRIIPYYTGAFTPPRSDDPWLLKPGDYTLKLVVRSENSSPESMELDLHIGQKWEDISCTVKR